MVLRVRVNTMNASALSEWTESSHFNEVLFLLVRRIQNGLIKQAEKELLANGIRLTYTQLLSIERIRKTENCRHSELADFLDYDTGSLTRLIDHLVRKGYVLRKRSNADRRSIILTLSREGISVLTKATKILDQRKLHATCGLAKVERIALFEQLVLIRDGLKTPATTYQ